MQLKTLHLSLCKSSEENRLLLVHGQLLILTEVLNLIHQNLRDKVAALEEDNWMYDGN